MMAWYLNSLVNIALSCEKMGPVLKKLSGKNLVKTADVFMDGASVKVYRCFNCDSGKVIMDLNETEYYSQRKHLSKKQTKDPSLL